MAISLKRSLFGTLSLALFWWSCGCSGAPSGGATTEDVGYSGVSAQMMFLLDESHVIIMDKAENNAVQVAGHPAWVVKYNLNTNAYEPMDVRTNTFCAGGAMAGDGSYVIVGGTRALGYGSEDGGFAINILHPDGGAWEQYQYGLQVNRWYATAEPLGDGSIMIVGGQNTGGYVPVAETNEPSLEYYPPRGPPIHMPILEETMPVNLFPLVFLLSNGQLFMQSGRKAILFDEGGNVVEQLPDVPVVPRPYPSSAGVVMLPMRAEDDYAQHILFCGGTDLQDKWGNLDGPATSTTDKPASKSCEMISPLGSKQWQTVDPLEEGRTMGMFTHLPDGTLFFGGGATLGTAGYTAVGKPVRTGNPVGQSLADAPSYRIMIFDPRAPPGSKWKQGPTMKHERMYHSSLSLLPDGSVLLGGSNPNEDVTDVHWPTSYSLERFYPSWYNDPNRPSNDQLPDKFSYGGADFEIQLDAPPAQSAYVRLIRTGFSTHGVSWASRSLELKGEVTGKVLRVTGLPDNPSLFVPGKVLAFLVVDGIPSQGKFAWVGPKQGQRRDDELDLRGMHQQSPLNMTVRGADPRSESLARRSLLPKPAQKPLHVRSDVIDGTEKAGARLAQKIQARARDVEMEARSRHDGHIVRKVRRHFL